MEASITTKEPAPMVISQLPKYKCEKHGEHDNLITSTVENHEGVWCMVCLVEKLEDLGVKKMEPTE